MVLLQLVTVDVVLGITGHLLQRRAWRQACRLCLRQVWLLLRYYCTVRFYLLGRSGECLSKCEFLLFWFGLVTAAILLHHLSFDSLLWTLQLLQFDYGLVRVVYYRS